MSIETYSPLPKLWIPVFEYASLKLLISKFILDFELTSISPLTSYRASYFWEYSSVLKVRIDKTVIKIFIFIYIKLKSNLIKKINSPERE